MMMLPTGVRGRSAVWPAAATGPAGVATVEQ